MGPCGAALSQKDSLLLSSGNTIGWLWLWYAYCLWYLGISLSFLKNLKVKVLIKLHYKLYYKIWIGIMIRSTIIITSRKEYNHKLNLSYNILASDQARYRTSSDFIGDIIWLIQNMNTKEANIVVNETLVQYSDTQYDRIADRKF